MGAPFVHRLRSLSGNLYCYDVNTNSFLLVDQAVYDVVEDVGILRDADVMAKWAPKHGADAAAAAVRSIRQQQKAGLLLDSHPSWMTGYDDLESLRAVYEPGPTKAVFEITAQCNLRCAYCVHSGTYVFERPHSSLKLSESAMRKVVEYMRSYALAVEESPVRYVSFYGGEPLLCAGAIRRLVDELVHDRKVDWKMHIATNGTLLEKDFAGFLVENDVGLQVSLDGPRHIHDRFRHFEDGSPTFDVVLSNLAMLRDLSPDYYSRVTFAATVGPGSDLMEIDGFFEDEELVKQHGVIVTHVDPFDTSLFEAYGPYTEQQMRQREQLKLDYISRVASGTRPTQVEAALFNRNLTRIDGRSSGRCGDRCPPNGTCYPGVSRVFVHADGRYSPCERAGDAYVLGNVDGGFDTSAARKLIDRYVAESEPECIGCWALRLCDLCYVACRRGRAFDMQRKKQVCALNLEKYNEALEIYASVMERNPQAFRDMKARRVRPDPVRLRS